ncbi:MAG: hypothetical protein IH586_16295, partial [Anaerolineaceae bacterium]|nr:hypothetical protein [Anaerolineaceae bacterium]
YKAAQEEFTLDQTVETGALTYLEKAARRDPIHFGNARAVNQLFEHMKTNLADRLVKVDDNQEQQLNPEETRLSTFVPDDVPQLTRDPLRVQNRLAGKILPPVQRGTEHPIQ